MTTTYGERPGMAERDCRACGSPATCDRLFVRNPELAARVVAHVGGYLRESDFMVVPLCSACADLDDDFYSDERDAWRKTWKGSPR